MAWYYGTYSCGHEGRVNIIGPCKDREWKSEREFSKMCPDCYKEWLAKERERKNAEADQAAEEMELPGLVGSLAQIKWANTIRVDAIRWLVEYANKIDLDKDLFQGFEKEGFSCSKETNLLAYDYGLKLHNDARFWIDNRFDFPSLAETFVKEYMESLKNAVPDDIKEEFVREKELLTVRPENATKNGIVIIQHLPNDKLAVSYAKDEDFRSIIKEKGFSFDFGKTAWIKKITEFTGSLDDRAADIGNSLLANGFTVCFETPSQLESAISGRFEPECDRWIKSSQEKGTLSISWEGMNDTLYYAAKKLPNAKWARGCMTVPVEYYREVIDFADTMGFRFSSAAQKRIDEYRELESSYQTASVTEPSHNAVTDKDRIRKSLVSSGTIIEDLIDES